MTVREARRHEAQRRETRRATARKAKALAKARRRNGKLYRQNKRARMARLRRKRLLEKAAELV